MRIKLLAINGPLLIAGAVAIGCAQDSRVSKSQDTPVSRNTVDPVSREQIVENLNPIVEVEQRGKQLITVMQRLPLFVEVNEESAKKLKEHYDIYYVYHNAATVSLAQGNFKVYKQQLSVASQELDSIEKTLKEIVEGKVSDSARPQAKEF